MPIDETRNTRIVFVVTHETRAGLERLAKLDRRRLGEYLRNLCEDHVAEQAQKELMTGADDDSGSMGLFPPPQL